MTDKISDEARELMEIVWRIGNRLTEYDSKKPEILQEIQSALTAARNQGLEDAAELVSETRGVHGYAQAAEIRAMKVQV